MRLWFLLYEFLAADKATRTENRVGSDSPLPCV